jgi:putative Mn2+ efflux pump MntP
MVFIEILFIAIGLSADAFSVSLGNGMRMARSNASGALRIAAAFGFFQAGMPLAGYFVGSAFSGVIEAYDHIVALILLAFIGGRMIYNGIKSYAAGQGPQTQTTAERELSAPSLITQAVATSIDALIVGVSFAAVGLDRVALVGAVSLIGAVTFALSFVAVRMGRRLGALLGSRAEIVGGLILVAIGLKIFFG